MQNSVQRSERRATVGLLMRGIAATSLLAGSIAIFTSAFASSAVDPYSVTTLEAGQANADGAISPIKTETAVQSQAGEAQPPGFSKAAKLISSFTVFLLAVFIGVEVINRIPATLHTPLMSGSNAISGITVIGAILTAGHKNGGFGAILGTMAMILAMINIAGGFIVTDRMLKMFKRR